MNAATKDTNPKDAAATARIPLAALSPIAKAHWALAMFAGRLKYGAWNWRRSGVRASIYLDAAMRHLDAYLSGETHDPVDGTHHLGNVMACCAIILDAAAAGKLNDDRPPIVERTSTYAELEQLAACLIEKYKDRSPVHCTISDEVEDELDPESVAALRSSSSGSYEVTFKVGAIRRLQESLNDGGTVEGARDALASIFDEADVGGDNATAPGPTTYPGGYDAPTIPPPDPAAFVEPDPFPSLSVGDRVVVTFGAMSARGIVDAIDTWDDQFPFRVVDLVWQGEGLHAEELWFRAEEVKRASDDPAPSA
jgi:hypothetical protein